MTRAASAASRIALSCTLRDEEYAGLIMPTFAIVGTISRRSAMRLPQIEGPPMSVATPVMLLPGWARLWTSCLSTRSVASTTTGIRGRQALKQGPAGGRRRR